MAEIERKGITSNPNNGWFDNVVDAVPVAYQYTFWYPWFLSIVFWLAIVKVTWTATQSIRYIGVIFRCKLTEEFLGKDWLCTTYDTYDASNYKMYDDNLDKKLRQDFRGANVNHRAPCLFDEIERHETRKPKVCEVTLHEIPFEDDGH